MTERSAHHATFSLTRRYPAAPARVFAAWAELERKKRWFGCAEDWIVTEATLDFRAGGREMWRVGPKDGPLHINETVYYDIVPNARIVYAYAMHIGETKISVSLTTIEIKPAGGATDLVFTEQGVFLDGYDGAAEREHGTSLGLDGLGAYLTNTQDRSGP